MKGRVTSHGGGADTVVRDFEGKLVLGRGAGCDLVLAAPTVSGLHASITYDAELAGFVLEDLGSTHGTMLDGTPVKQPERLGHLNVISLAGSIDLLFQDLAKCASRHSGQEVAGTTTAEPVAAEPANAGTIVKQAEPPSPPPPSQAEPPPPPRPPEKPAVVEPPAATPESTVHAVVIPPPLVSPDTADAPVENAERTVIGTPSSGPALPGGQEPAAEENARPAQHPAQQLKLVFTDPIEDKRDYPLQTGENTVGRSVNNHIARARAELSRSHAIVTLREGRIFIRDCGSSHGTTVNGARISEGEEVEVQIGATISFGIDDARLEAE